MRIISGFFSKIVELIKDKGFENSFTDSVELFFLFSGLHSGK